MDIAVLDDSGEVNPPPFSSMLLDVNIKSEKLTPDVRRDSIKRISLQGKGGEVKVLEGDEADILYSHFFRSSFIVELLVEVAGVEEPQVMTASIDWQAELLVSNISLRTHCLKSAEP